MTTNDPVTAPFNTRAALSALAAAACAASCALASSHREAPFVTEMPKVDGTDFYMFNSYEPGRAGFVTIVANYQPLQDPYGGPNYFTMDPDALYQIHIDNNGDAREDITFEFRFTNTLRDLAVNVGGQMVSVPLINIGPIGPGAADNGALNVQETFTCSIIRGHRYLAPRQPLSNAAGFSTQFRKPADNIGFKSIPQYEAYAASHLYTVRIPGCDIPGRMFVGQRKDPFVVNLGEAFDLVNLNPLGPVDGKADVLADKNVTSLILEVPAACLVRPGQPIIGGWTTASLRQNQSFANRPTFRAPDVDSGPLIQVSRLGAPLVNELVIGLRDKNLFNASEPRFDGQFALYVTNPTLPVLLNALFGVTPPCTPRNDLVAAFLTGVAGLNQPPNVVSSEMLRLNTSTPPVPKGAQSNLGVLGGDIAGFPNGRRLGDDVVDIALRVVMGAIVPGAGNPAGCAPSGALPLTDGAFIDDSFFDNAFPYIRTPIPGSPNMR